MDDREIKAYLKEYPEATVISIGSGLDTTFSRVDNGTLTWYDLGLPEIIELRRKYVRSHERVRTISTVADRFPGARMYFNSTSKAGLKISNRYVRKTGNSGAEMYLGMNSARRYFAPLYPKIREIADCPFDRNISFDKS